MTSQDPDIVFTDNYVVRSAKTSLRYATMCALGTATRLGIQAFANTQ